MVNLNNHLPQKKVENHIALLGYSVTKNHWTDRGYYLYGQYCAYKAGDYLHERPIGAESLEELLIKVKKEEEKSL